MHLSFAEMQLGNFIIFTKSIRKRLTKIRRKKSVGSDGFPAEIMKLGGETMTPYLSTFREISLNNATIPSEWKRATVVHIHKGGDRWAVSEYRPISLNCEVCKQWEHVIAGYLRQVWDKNDRLCEGHHGFREGYSCEFRVNTVRQYMADALDEVIVIDNIIVEFFKVFVLVPHDRLFTKLGPWTWIRE